MITGIATWLAAKLWGNWLLKIAGFVGKAFAWAFSSWKHVVICVLAVATAYFWLSAGKWQGRAEKALAAVEARDATIKSMADGIAKAKAMQIALNAATKAAYERNAKDTDNANTIALKDAMGRARRYRAANGVPAQKDRSGTIGTDSTAQSQLAESDNRSGGNAELVAISGADFDNCTVNSVRLEQIHKWGTGLIGDGVAE